VIPTAWIDAAQARWTKTPPREQMTAIGLDVAQGGEAFSVAAPRYGGWYAPLTRKPGRECQKG
jgi:nitrate/nitrite transporter NarK